MYRGCNNILKCTDTAGAAQHSGSGSYSFNPVLSSNNALKAPLERQQEPHNIQAQVPIVLTLFYPLTRSKGSIGPTAGTTQYSGRFREELRQNNIDLDTGEEEWRQVAV